MTLVSTDWLNNNLGKVKIFDASWHLPNVMRDAKKEYLEKHIPGTIFWNLDEHSDKDSPYPHMLPNSDYWTRMLWKFGITNDDHIIVYDNSLLYTSCRLWFSLKYFGHKRVSILNGGFQKWLKEKRPISQNIDKTKQSNSYKINENINWIKNKKQIDENIKSNLFVLVDARSRERFEGKIEEPRPGLIKGNIPASKNIPYQNCINSETNIFKTKSELVKIFKENDVDYNKPLVFSCGSGVTACVLSLAYFLISDKHAVIYDGSFSEWGKK